MTPQPKLVCSTCQALLESLKIARWFLITAHDAHDSYVKAALAKVDAAIARAERER